PPRSPPRSILLPYTTLFRSSYFQYPPTHSHDHKNQRCCHRISITAPAWRNRVDLSTPQQALSFAGANRCAVDFDRVGDRDGSVQGLYATHCAERTGASVLVNVWRAIV